ncbi:MAG: NAD(P)-binding domain-containing protein [Porphyromonadaceae bacterium]|nr:NAD(P)-binding domain-containing protein [Porphyromonadaceae bacterium]
MKKVLIAYRLKPEGLRVLEGKYAVTLPTEKSSFSREEVLAMIPDFEVLVPNFSFYTDQEIMEHGSKLELISNWGVGFNNIDVDYATQKGIAVTNIPDSTREPTAEFAFGLLLAAGRRISYYDRKLRSPEGVSWGIYAEAGLSIYGKTLGIIGMGRIGQSLARRAVASGMEIIYHNRNRLSREIEKNYNATYVSLDNLLSTADYVSLNAPSTKDTRHMIGERELDIMKPTAVFINTARGEMVDERALADALRNNKIWAAALDVFENEPHILPELLTLDNVILAPHAGTKTVEARLNMSIEMARNIVGFYEGTFPVSRVNETT